MSIRNVWVFSLSNDDFGKVIFSRTFATVEKRFRILHGSSASIPSPEVFASRLLVRLGLSKDSKQYIQSRDEASRIMQLPVVEINVGEQEIWPLVVVEQSSFLVCCLPLVENADKVNKEDILKIPSISVGFSVVIGILNLIGQYGFNLENNQFVELGNFLTLSMPFGTPSDMELSCVSHLYNSSSHVFSKKQPSWKPIDFKGKQQIVFKISEFVRCAQSDQTKCHPVCEVFGQVSVKADLDGAINDVSISVNNAETSQPLNLDSIIVHPAVQIHSGPTASATGLLRRLRFTPPLHHFILFHYCSPTSNEPPIHGVFKMLGEESVELLLQLRLNAKMKNCFDFCDVLVTFFHCGPVQSLEYNSNHGLINLSEDKHSLKWNLGTKFPKDLEVVLTAKLKFKDKPMHLHGDPFCIEKNCYAQINFKQTGANLSGCNIDPKTVTISPTSKPKLVIDRNLQTAEYRLWNSYGDLPFPVNIANKFQQIWS